MVKKVSWGLKVLLSDKGKFCEGKFLYAIYKFIKIILLFSVHIHWKVKSRIFISNVNYEKSDSEPQSTFEVTKWVIWIMS